MAMNRSIHPLPTGNRYQILQPVTNRWRNELPCRVTMMETLSQSSMMMMMMMMMPPPPPPPTTTTTVLLAAENQSSEAKIIVHDAWHTERISRSAGSPKKRNTAGKRLERTHSYGWTMARRLVASVSPLSARVQTWGSPRTCVGQTDTAKAVSLRVLLTPPVNYHSINAP